MPNHELNLNVTTVAAALTGGKFIKKKKKNKKRKGKFHFVSFLRMSLMSPLSAFIYALRITCDFLAFVAFVSADGHCHPTGVFLDFSPIFFELVSLFSLFFLDCTRDFRNHWIKGKSKLNCPRGCADQKFTTVRVLNVAQTLELFARPFSDFGPVSPFPAPFSAFPLGAHLKLRVLPLHLAANIRSVK